nr:MAG TPA: hypothetical protein [Caudoviricetes sp.]
MYLYIVKEKTQRVIGHKKWRSINLLRLFLFYNNS